MAIDKDLILKLRNVSQAGFADCKKALEENNNDLDASIKWLRSKGIAKANNKNALKDAKEGGTWAKKDDNGVVILELNSETDFTANNSEFSKLAEGIANVILESKTTDRETILQLEMENGETVNNNCLHLSSITGEKIVLTRVRYFALSDNESAACYRHNNGKISTVIVFDKKLPDSEIAGLAVHYAANNPRFITESEVDSSWINDEKEIILEALKKENKPEQFHAKIVEERIKKLIAQSTFVEQNYLYDQTKTVRDVLASLGTSIRKAVYYGLGGA
ncbi:translation elongation factor Ts [Candidatus Mycoplasma haematohominis]|nr:translation elongation factor Ts [Candidatus Mycoplasma haemohominis]